MSLAALNRWHWGLVAVMVGVLGGFALGEWVGEPYGPVVNGLGFQLTSAEQFESAVAGELAGQRLFKELVIHPRWTVDGQGRPIRVDVVAGLYCDGRLSGSGGDRTAVWRPTCFIAGRPYRPAATAPWMRPGETVADYLAGVSGTRFTTDWWEAYPFATSLATSLILIGGIWPTAVNLIAFGSLTRPAEVKGMSLWRVQNRPRPSAPQPFACSGSEPPVMQTPPPLVAAAPESTAPVPFRPAVSEPLAPIAERELTAAEYAKRKDDYYPTVKRDTR